MIFKKDISYAALIVVLMVLLSYPIIFGFPEQIIGWDAFGYYLYLPQTFIENDIAISNVQPINEAISNYQMTPSLYQAHPLENGNQVIQYTSGLAILYSAFFFIAHLIANFSDYAADGYSAPYQWMMIVGSYTYFVVGLIFLRKVLRTFFSPAVTAIVLILIGFGTNYYVIHTLSHGMPHVYLFTLYTLLLWQTIQWHQAPSIKRSLYMGVVLGLMALSRPTEIMAALIPLLYGVNSRASFIAKIKMLVSEKLRLTIALILSIALIGSIQLIYWKHVTGSFFYNSYSNPGEGMELFYPHTLDFLFSFRKGWFIYTPIAFLGIIGLFRLKDEIRKNWFWGLIVFSVMNIYISSCWSNWWYATSFGQRTMVQSYVVIAIGLGGLFYLPYTGKIRGKVIATICLLFLGLNLFQSWQYKVGIIHPDRMTSQAYFAGFGKTQIPENFNEMLLVDRKNKNIKWDNYRLTRTIPLEEGREITFSDEYGPKIEIPFEDITENDHALIVTSLELQASSPNLLLVQTFMHDQGNYGYQMSPLEFLKAATLEKDKYHFTSVNYITPNIRIPSDKFRTFLWNRDRLELSFKSFKIQIFERK